MVKMANVCIFYHNKKLKKIEGDLFHRISACLCLLPLGLRHAGVQMFPRPPYLLLQSKRRFSQASFGGQSFLILLTDLNLRGDYLKVGDRSKSSPNSIDFLRKINVLSFSLGLLFVLFSLRTTKLPNLTLCLCGSEGRSLAKLFPCGPVISQWVVSGCDECFFQSWCIRTPTVLRVLSLLVLQAGCRRSIGGSKVLGHESHWIDANPALKRQMEDHPLLVFI